MELCIGYIFKKKNIDFNRKNYDVFHIESIEIGEENREERYFQPITGNNLNKINLLMENRNERGEYIAINASSSEEMFKNLGRNFEYFKEYACKTLEKHYYIRNNNSGLEVLQNQQLIELAEKEFFSKKDRKEFTAENLEDSTDISKMYNSIKETIISQDEQIMQILTSIFKNQTVIKSKFDNDLISKLKENILIYGPTGTGKTEILKRISKLYEIPIVIEDSTSLSETGYVGRKITDLLRDLYYASNNNMEIAQKSILVLDEFDKLAEKGNVQDHVSRIGVQRSLLKLLEGSELYFDEKKFDTSKLTIVALGAFTDITNESNYNNLTSKDFIEYGVMRELLGRFSKNIAMNPLGKEDIIKILLESNFSPINTYKELFELMKVEFTYDEDFVSWIADKAMILDSGARCLKTIFDDCLSGAMFRIFAGEYSKINLIRPKNEGDSPYLLTKNKKRK